MIFFLFDSWFGYELVFVIGERDEMGGMVREDGKGGSNSNTLLIYHHLISQGATTLHFAAHFGDLSIVQVKIKIYLDGRWSIEKLKMMRNLIPSLIFTSHLISSYFLSIFVLQLGLM